MPRPHNRAIPILVADDDYRRDDRLFPHGMFVGHCIEGITREQDKLSERMYKRWHTFETKRHHTSQKNNLLLQIIQFIHHLLMFLFGIVHGIETIHVLLGFPVDFVQFFIPIRRGTRTDLQNHRHLGVGQYCRSLVHRDEWGDCCCGRHGSSCFYADENEQVETAIVSK